MTGFPDADPRDLELLETATEAARAAADVHLSRRPDAGGDGWAEKGRSDFVTEVDREAERQVVELIRDRFPGHVVLAEEAADAGGGDGRSRAGARGDGPGARSGDPEGGGPEAPPAEPRGAAPDGRYWWIVDPLDGTTNWLHGYPEYAVSIACADPDGLRVAVVLNSAEGELFRAVRGAGSRRDGEPIRISPVREPRLALVGTGFPFKKEELVRPYLESLGRVLAATSGVRRAGSAALDLCDLACGRLDAFWELWLMPWDVAAGALIVREAGGVFSPLAFPGVPTGDPAVPGAPELRSGAFVAGNPHLVGALERLVLEGA
jgi:myo-inositol-1(or 4)-monophosphatase